MRFRVLFWSVWLLLALAFSVRFIFADGEPCYDCQNCWENIINCATNGGNCSSNCVKMTPEQCSNFVAAVTNQIDSITQNVAEVRYDIQTYKELLESNVLPVFDDCTNAISVVLSLLDDVVSSNSFVSSSVDSALSHLASSVTYINQLSNHWSTIDGPSISGLSVSNLVSHSTVTLGFMAKVTRYVKLIVPRLSSAVDILSSLPNDNISANVSAAKSDLEIVLTFVDDARYNLVQNSSYLDWALDALSPIEESSRSLVSSVEMVNCEPCGRGSSSGGGSSGGTVDFTGVSAQLDQIKTLLQQVYDLIYNYFTDYNSARSHRPSGEPSYDGYVALGDNWFKRVEYLLYSSSSISSNNLEGTSDPDTVQGQTVFESETSQLQESVDTITGSFDQSLSRPWSKFSEHFSQFWDRLNAFKLPGQSSGQLGQLEWSHLDILSYSKDGHGFTLQAESGLDGFSSVWYKFAVGFRVLWFLLTLTLYCLFFIFMIKYSFKVAAFVAKLLNTSFGSG